MTLPLGSINSSLSLDTRKLNLIKFLSTSDDEQIIAAIEELLRKKRIAAYEARMQPMSEAAYLEKIGRGIDDIKNGRVTSVEDYLKEIEQEEN